MRFLNNELSFFTAYGEDNPRTFIEDLSYVVGDFLEAAWEFIKHLKDFVVYSVPLTLGIISLSSSFLLLSLPIAQQLLTLNVPIVLIASVLALPAVYPLGMALVEFSDMLISPCVNALKILSNLCANVVEAITSADIEDLVERFSLN